MCGHYHDALRSWPETRHLVSQSNNNPTSRESH
jgi:hypothetical protein